MNKTLIILMVIFSSFSYAESKATGATNWELVEKNLLTLHSYAGNDGTMVLNLKNSGSNKTSKEFSILQMGNCSGLEKYGKVEMSFYVSLDTLNDSIHTIDGLGECHEGIVTEFYFDEKANQLVEKMLLEESKLNIFVQKNDNQPYWVFYGKNYKKVIN